MKGAGERRVGWKDEMERLEMLATDGRREIQSFPDAGGRSPAVCRHTLEHKHKRNSHMQNLLHLHSTGTHGYKIHIRNTAKD